MESVKTWAALIVAGLMVVSIGTVFVIGGENEVDLPVGVDIWLTYSAVGDYNGTEINGTYECFIHKQEGSGWSAGIGYNMTGNMEEVYPNLPKVLVHGSYLEDAEIATQWGTKQVQRCIYASFDEQQGLFISNTGAQTDIEYHVNYISPVSHVTFDLIEIGIDGFESYDQNPAQDSDLFAENRHANDYSGTSGPYSSMLVEPRDDEYYHIYINSTNSTIIVMDGEDISNMMNGGDYQFCSEWSVFGNGSTDYLIRGELVFFLCYPTVSDLSDVHIQVEVDVFDD